MGEGGEIFRAKELPRALCQCHHGDGKVDALNPKQNISDANGDETGEEGSDGPGQEPRPIVVGDEETAHITAHADEPGETEIGIPC